MQRVAHDMALLLIALAPLTGCVWLGRFYEGTDPKTPIGLDPIGGFVLFYWVDADGTACHGAPGTSGQPGPAAIDAVKPAALQSALDLAPVTAAQVADYQSIPYSVAKYLESQATGYHVFQFDNLFWRGRGDGKAFRDSFVHYYSVPQVIDIDNLPVTISPALIWGECQQAQFIALPSAGIAESGQHPTKCLSKVFPSFATTSTELLQSKCITRLQEGRSYRVYE